MYTLQGLKMQSDYMMEQMRRNVIDYTLEKFKIAARNYYTKGYDSGESVKYIKELEELGVNMDCILDIEFEIRDEVENRKEV